MSFNPQARDHAALITSDAQALQVARELASQFKAQSAQRDRERRLPHAELDIYSQSGLWGISVPKAFGGAGVSNVTLAWVIQLISEADGSLGQIPQNHFYALEPAAARTAVRRSADGRAFR